MARYEYRFYKVKYFYEKMMLIFYYCQEDHKANIFTGEEELFAFDRTVSRLSEMQTLQYWEQWEHHR